MSIDLVSQIEYPDSDGRPMADNTLQYEWIVTIKGGLDGVFQNDPQVFVAGDLLWYPVEGDNKTRVAPDAMVAFGRPKGYRGSYKQWQEGGIAPQVVFEVLSPGNTVREMSRKLRLYERFGVEEYYEFDPDRMELRGWLRDGETLDPIEEMQGWTSPRLGIRFELAEDLTIYEPSGRRFKTFEETRDRDIEMTRQADEERQRADEQEQRADEQEQRADEQEQRANEERLRADEQQRRAERLAERLRALGLDTEV